MHTKRIVILFVTVLILAATVAVAQPDKGKSWTGNIAGGYVAPIGETGDKTSSGWNLQGGATFRPEDWAVGIFMELGYTDMGIKREIRDALRVDNGGINFWNLGGGVIWQPRLKGDVGFYVNAGLGAYRVDAELTNNTVIPGFVCDPWWPWLCYPALVPGEVVVESRTTTDIGYNLGVGLTFELGSLSMLYLEARYNRVPTEEGSLEYMPIVFGYRW